MAQSPFKTARDYYGQALPNQSQSSYWTSEEQKPPYSTSSSFSNSVKFTATLGGIGAAGFLPVGKTGKHAWDYYVNAFRGVEEYSPGGIFRTFQLSNIFSSFETPVRNANLHISPESLRKNKTYIKYLAQLIGEQSGRNTYFRLLKEGATLRSNRLYFGKGTDVALQYASAIRATGTGAASRIGEAYSRVLGLDIRNAHHFFAAAEPRTGIFNPVIQGMPVQIIGGKSYGQHFYRKTSAIGTELVERFNRLLDAPFEMQPFKTIFGRVQSSLQKNFGFQLRFGVEKSTGLKMLGSLALKYGPGLGVLALGYQTADYALRNSSILDKTIFSEGLTAGVATLGVQSNLFASRIAEVSGLHNYREKQEQIAPGSTSLTKLAAFPLMGGIGTGLLGYGYRVGRMAQLQNQSRISVGIAKELVDKEMHDFSTFGLKGLGESLTSKHGLYARSDWIGSIFKTIADPSKSGDLEYKFLGKLTPLKLLSAAGAIAGTAAVLPFLPGALIPSTRPDELEAIYSGKKDIAIRKGRWWEMGRCLIKSNTYKTFDNRKIKSDEIKINDILIGRDFKPAKVINIFTRHHTGLIRKFYTAIDRDIFTGLTENHIVPVLRDNSVIEIEAKDIILNDYVEIPFKILREDTDNIISLNYIKEPVFLQNDRIYSSQMNWFSRKIQKSGTTSIPLNLKLDKDLGSLFGYFLAEGNISFKENIPQFIETVHAKQEQWIVNEIIRICKDKFNIEPTVRFKTTGKLAKEGCWIVRICSSILAKLFKGLFYSEPYLKHNKIIHSDLNNSNIEFKKAFIEGYFNGDGHLDNESKIITSSRKWLLETIQLWALNMNIPCGISIHRDNVFFSWRIRFYSDSIKNTNPGCKFHNQRLFARIRCIEEEYYNDTVYDFEVDDKDHLLQAGTFLVHNSPYEGEGITTFVPHWYPSLLQRSRDRSIWNEQEYGEISPLNKFFKKNFTYDLERMHYQDRPYPVSGTAFSDVPLIGPLLSSTIGRIFKPPVQMHTEEWRNERGETLVTPGRKGTIVATGLGQLPGGQPVSPHGFTQVLGEQLHRLTEMTGLPGFAATSIKERLTGTKDFFADQGQLESASRMTSTERWYWDQELGGMGGTNEAFRRLYPHRNRDIDLYNPIKNQMPSWLPGAGDKSVDFSTGDPYVKIPLGEQRLPGEGYAARFTELEGIDPEDYPDIHKFRILADVAPYSEKYGEMVGQIRKDRASSQWTDYEENIYQQTVDQLKQKKQKLTFQDYQYLSPMGNISSGSGSQGSSDLISYINEQNKAPKPGFLQSLFGGYWEAISHNAETPFDQLTPFSPGAKLVHQRTAIESYERTQIYGTKNAFWQHPVRDFIAPFGRLIGKSLGFEGISSDIKHTRDVEQYFDILEYVKSARLANVARMAHDEEAEKEFESKKEATLFGLNPYTRNYTAIFNSLPARDRDYFNAFSIAKTTEERAKILELVPDNEKALYIARWKILQADDIKAATKAGILSKDQLNQADEQLETIFEEAKNEGFPSTKELTAEFIATRSPGENYGDWYRRTKLLPEVSMPGADWVGWHPSVDLEDVKLKVVETLGEDMHDYGLWPSRLKDLAYKPFIDEEAIEPLLQPQKLSSSQIRDRINEVLLVDKMGHNTFITNSYDSQDSVSLNIEQDRSEDMEEIIEKGWP